MVIVAGGYDTTFIPSIGYGLLGSERRRSVAFRTFSKAARVLVVDQSLKSELERNLGLDGSNIQVVHTGFDPEVFRPHPPKTRKTVLTVANVNAETVRRKGLDNFVKTARYLPDFEFCIVGRIDDASARRLQESAPPNVKMPGGATLQELVPIYQRTHIYAQLSLFEGLPSALAEAMLCECIPVGTRLCGIPTLMGDTGFYVPYGDPKATADAIELAAKATSSHDARLRIAEHFHVAQREHSLLKVIDELAGR